MHMDPPKRPGLQISIEKAEDSLSVVNTGSFTAAHSPRMRLSSHKNVKSVDLKD